MKLRDIALLERYPPLGKDACAFRTVSPQYALRLLCMFDVDEDRAVIEASQLGAAGIRALYQCDAVPVCRIRLGLCSVSAIRAAEAALSA